MKLTSGVSFRAVAGFACQQGFLYSLFYLGSNRALDIAGVGVERIDLFFTLAFMAAAFLVVRFASARARNALLAPTLLGWYAVLLVVGSLLLVFPFEAGLAEVAAEGALIGLPSGMLLCAWGRVLVRCPRFSGAREILFATALGALVCLLVSAVPVAGASDFLKLLPIGSVWALRQLSMPAPDDKAGSAQRADASSVSSAAGEEVQVGEGVPLHSALSVSTLVASSEERSATARLSMKVVAGTTLFGVAAGFMEVFSSEPGMVTTPTFPATLLFVVLFCLAAAQLFMAMASTDDENGDADQGSLSFAGVYRLAILLTMAGYLFVPVLGGFGITGQAIVLSGYLGLTCVLMMLFLAIARASAHDAATAFARGFFALYAGEAVGLLLGNALECIQPEVSQPLAVAAFAGLASLFAYLFLFTENDYVELSAIATDIDSFDETCARISTTYGLSKREAEVLPLALRGRTSERIAAELYISKSTVDTHLRRIYAKTGVHSRQELIDLSESK